VPITLTWEHINAYTLSSKDGLFERLMFFKEEIPPRKIINNGKFFF